MDREKIEKILKALIKVKEDSIARYVVIDEDGKKTELLYRDIAKEIEQGDYEYFISKIYDEDYQSEHMINILIYLSADKNEDKKRFLETYKEFGISDRLTIELVKSINDPEYTKMVVDNMKEYGLYSFSEYDLIKTIKDPRFVKMFIDEKEKYGLNTYLVMNLIKDTNDPKFIKECIEEYEKYGLDNYLIMYLIKNIDDSEFIKKCIDEKEKYGLDISQIKSLINQITDPKYIRLFVEEKEKYELWSDEIFFLLIKANDPELIKKCIIENERYGLNEFPIFELLYKLNDPELTKKCISENERYGLNSSQIFELLYKFNNPELTKKCISENERYGLNSSQIFDLLKKVNDPDLTKKFISENDKYGFNNSQLFDLLKKVNDLEFIKKCFAEKEKFHLHQSEICNLIETINKPLFTKECLEQWKKYELDYYQVVSLINLSEDPEELIWYLENYKKYDFNLEIINLILDLNPKIFFLKFDNILEIFKNEDIYEELIRHSLGEVELDENNKPIISNEIRKLFLSKADYESFQNLKTKLPEIIAKWDLIKEQIQYKRANYIKDSGLEVRNNLKEIFGALLVLNRTRPQTATEAEFDSIPENDRLETDVQYIDNAEKASTTRIRAYELAEKMDKSGTKKYFPDFTTKYENISVEVSHPQDKSAILLGYDVQCCFRPNGNADNSGENEYSLLQYCTTTPYGGVIKCIDKNDNSVQMGTPILRNGNMLMFHSFETKKCKECEKVNIAIENAAKKAIELSNGGIKAVFMTTVHTGEGRLRTEGRLTIDSYFREYTEKEYENYYEMYNNLESDNVVLAIECDGKILTGEEIIEWFNKECDGNEDIFKEKLGLRFGEVNDSYEFPRRKIEQEIIIENNKLVDKFYNIYQENVRERTALSLMKEKKKLEEKGTLSEDDEKQLKFIESELEKYTELTHYTKLSKNEIKRELEKNTEDRIKIISGDNLEIIKDYYGITEEDINKKLEKEIDNNTKKEETSSKENVSNKAKMEKSKIISQIKQTGNSELISLIPNIAKETISSEDLERLKTEYNIDTDGYTKYFINKESIVDSKELLENKKRQQIREMKKNPRTIERVMSEILFENIKDDEINTKIFEDTITDIKSSIYKYYIDQKKDKIIKEEEERKKAEEEAKKEAEEEGKIKDITISEEEKAVINEKIHNLNLEKTLDKYLKNGFKIDENIDGLDKNIEELMNYGISMEKVYKKYANNPKDEIRKIRLDKFDKIKSSITLGIRKKETWIDTKAKISDRNENEKIPKLEKVIYGNSWFIEYAGGKTTVYLSNKAQETEKEDFKQALKSSIEQAKTEKGQPQISMKSIKEVVSIVSLGDKEEASKIIAEVLKETNERGEE